MNKLFLISGPCIVENESTPMIIAKEVKAMCDELGIEYIFKASYRKANRTREDSFRGIGDEEALRIIQGIGEELNIRTLSDVHESHEVPMVAEFVDVLQIPAFLCRQTELLHAAGRTGKTVNIKKGQFVSPEAMKFPIEKVKATGNENVWICERGFTFGYEDLIVDATVIPRLRKHGVPVVMDCTHSLQAPNQTSGISGGNPVYIETIALVAAVTNADGLFIETHPNPSKALSDGATMLHLDLLYPILQKVMRIRQALD
ncbi:MAG TPA: 3-deoxy-8-phosphooctulonate synthase [Saprospiraceae bacterium]|nr:3-deoxy-8-phosphooctulonate synthase [Saprospiraceae bacterium]